MNVRIHIIKTSIDLLPKNNSTMLFKLICEIHIKESFFLLLPIEIHPLHFEWIFTEMNTRINIIQTSFDLLPESNSTMSFKLICEIFVKESFISDCFR